MSKKIIGLSTYRGETGEWGRVGHPVFGTIESATRQRPCAALITAYPVLDSYSSWTIIDIYNLYLGIWVFKWNQIFTQKQQYGLESYVIF